MSGAANLFDKAVSNLRSAQLIFDHRGEDDEQLNMVGYHLQKAVELALKYLLEQDGIEYPKTHDVDQLIRMGREAAVELHLSEYVEDHAEMFSQWEARLRYVVEYAIEERKAERALREVDDYLAAVAAKLNEEMDDGE